MLAPPSRRAVAAFSRQKPPKTAPDAPFSAEKGLFPPRNRPESRRFAPRRAPQAWDEVLFPPRFRARRVPNVRPTKANPAFPGEISPRQAASWRVFPPASALFPGKPAPRHTPPAAVFPATRSRRPRVRAFFRSRHTRAFPPRRTRCTPQGGIKSLHLSNRRPRPTLA